MKTTDKILVGGQALRNLGSDRYTNIDQFIIEVSLIAPIEKIISQLENGEFRDCDIKWLDAKLENFIGFAAKTLGINAITPSSLHSETFVFLNNFSLVYYKEKFTTLLNYFKSI